MRSPVITTPLVCGNNRPGRRAVTRSVQRADFPRAISAYEKAIEVSPAEVGPQLDQTLEETHYRLAQAYQRTGDKTKAQEELELHRQLAKKTKEDAERKRREIQQFVISLRNKDSGSQPQH